MENEIQKLLDRAVGEVRLPPGEFEGPFTLKKALIVRGNSTTLWARKGPVFVIEEKGAMIKNLRVEVTEPEGGQSTISILSRFADTVYEQVEISGEVSGAGKEDECWDIPFVLKAGNILADKTCTVRAQVFVPVEVSVNCAIKDVSINPQRLKVGKNEISITMNKVSEGTFFYGNILFESRFIRKCCFTASAKKQTNSFEENKLIYTVSKQEAPLNQQIIEHSKKQTPLKFSMIENPNSISLKKGQRISCKDLALDKIKLKINYGAKNSEMDIDPYVFLLDKNNKAHNDENLVFFGNKSSLCGGITLLENASETTIELNLKIVSNQIDRIAVAYSIYGDNPNFNFSKVINPSILIFSDGIEKMRFSPEDLFIETTIVFVEFYRYKGEWKLSTVGAGYRDGLKRLCESYGLIVSGD